MALTAGTSTALPATVSENIEVGKMGEALNVDENGSIDTQYGRMIVRYMLGITGPC